MEQAFGPLADRQQRNGSRTVLKAHHRDPLRITAKGGDVFPNPMKCLNLIKQPQIRGVRKVIPTGNLRKIDKSKNSKSVVKADNNGVRMRRDEMLSVQQRVCRSTIGKIAVMKQHQHRFPCFCLAGSDKDI